MSLERFAYVIAFRDDRFVMVRHRDRAWEMPGGRVNEGESFEDAARREFLEETGMELEVAGVIELGDSGRVIAGLAGRRIRSKVSDEVVGVREFRELPSELSFPEVEYRGMLAQARTIAETFKSRKGIVAATSPLNRLHARSR